ncbi:hypothetical protein AMJ87_03440 [candidate division WOR_3 bacterium SM23_60]|uniref:Uncharacterized protein n=1 Tax=candidate division WOR_3 bacterium SM23_60 TaxID=1703780 RepID=A0A0S8GLV6_UNCW3|nr:MAG: hypothetical protein AMJ87_03440 [candidate division WOR_3 bacterium SM23_60]
MVETCLRSRSKEIATATREDFYDYSAQLIKVGKNTADNYISILRYAYFKKLNELIIAGMEVLDGSEVIENFSNRLVSEFNQELRDYIFEGIKLPALGISPDEKPKYTRKLIARLEGKIGVDECMKFLNRGLRDRYEESRKPDREKFLKSKNIDEFLKQKHKDFVVELERHFKNNTLFFTQEISEEVLEHVKSDPYIESGVREGNKIIIKKIPHMAKEYLAEKDERKKRYYYCHCPWVKEAFEESDKPISPVFCSCSAGFYRAYWEIVFDQPVQVDVLASLLNGDPICKFAVHIPDNVTTG